MQWAIMSVSPGRRVLIRVFFASILLPGEGISSVEKDSRNPMEMVLGFFFDPFPNYHVRTNAFMMSRTRC